MKYLSLSLILFFFFMSCQGPDLDQDLASKATATAAQAAKSVQFTKIIEALDKQNYEEALNLSKQLPESAYKYNFMGVAHRHLGNPKQAIVFFQKAIAAEGEKNLGNILINLGHTLGDLGDRNASEAEYNLALGALDQTDTHKRGIIHLYLGDINTAIHFFEAALEGKRNSQLASSYNYLAYVYYLAGDLDKSLHYINLASEIQHDSVKVKIQTKTFSKIIADNEKNTNGNGSTNGGVKEDMYP